MRLWICCSAVILALALNGCGPSEKSTQHSNATETSDAATPAAEVPLEATRSGGPKRADGFWETRLGDSTTQYCVGDDSEEKWSLVDDLSVLGDCSKKEFKRIPSGWSFETVCTMMGTTTTQKGTITGDFRTGYVIDQVVTTTPGGTHEGQLVARRIGDCPPEYKPGDKIRMGMRVNLLGAHN